MFVADDIRKIIIKASIESFLEPLTIGVGAHSVIVLPFRRNQSRTDSWFVNVTWKAMEERFPFSKSLFHLPVKKDSIKQEQKSKDKNPDVLDIGLEQVRTLVKPC